MQLRASRQEQHRAEAGPPGRLAARGSRSQLVGRRFSSRRTARDGCGPQAKSYKRQHRGRREGEGGGKRTGSSASLIVSSGGSSGGGLSVSWSTRSRPGLAEGRGVAC